MPTQQYDQATRIRAITELGIRVPGDLQAVQRLPVDQAMVKLEELKALVKRNYGALCLKYHPDHTGGDEEKTRWFKVLTYEKGEFLKLEVRPAPQPQPMPVGVGMRTGGGVPFTAGFPFGVQVNVTGAPNGTATTWTGVPGMPGFVVSFIRFR